MLPNVSVIELEAQERIRVMKFVLDTRLILEVIRSVLIVRGDLLSDLSILRDSNRKLFYCTFHCEILVFNDKNENEIMILFFIIIS